MRFFIFAFAALFFIPAIIHGQQAAAVEKPVKVLWTSLGEPVEGTKGFSLFSRGMRVNPKGQYELWVKIVPEDAKAFIRSYNLPNATAYVVQYATIDCGKKLVGFERSSAFDGEDKTIQGKTSGISLSEKRKAVKPGSIGDEVYKRVCVDPSINP